MLRKWIAGAVIVAAYAFALVLSGTAAGAAGAQGCAFDYPMLADGDCRAYHAKWIAARSADERNAVFDEMMEFIRASSRARGVALDNWQGFSPATHAAAARR